MRPSTIPIAVGLLTLATACLASDVEDWTLWGELQRTDAVVLVTVEDVRLQKRLAETSEGDSPTASDRDSCAPALIVGKVQRIVYQRDPQQVMPAGVFWDDSWCSHFGAWPRSAILAFKRTDAGWDQEPLALDLGDELTTSRLAFYVERAKSLLATSPVNPRKLAEWAVQIALEEDERLRDIGIELLAHAKLPVAIAADGDSGRAVRLSEFVTPREIDRLIEPVSYDFSELQEWSGLLEAFTRERAPALYEEIADGLTGDLEEAHGDGSELWSAMATFLRTELVGRTENFASLGMIYGSDCRQLRHIWAEASRQQLVPGDPVPIDWWHPELMPKPQAGTIGRGVRVVLTDDAKERSPSDEPADESEADDSRE